MKCIFPCLQLIYFYMGVDYIALCCFVWFSLALFWVGGSKMEKLVLHCICPAETNRAQTKKDLVYNRRGQTF